MFPYQMSLLLPQLLLFDTSINAGTRWGREMSVIYFDLLIRNLNMDGAFVKNEIRIAVTEKLKRHNFLFNKTKRIWERSIPAGIQIFDLIFYVYPDEILIEPVFRIKLHLIEDVYHQVTIKKNEFSDGTVTLGNSLGQILKYFNNGDNIGSGEQISYVVKNEQDIEILKEVIPSRFEEYILPYFETNSSIEKVSELLNETPRDMSIHNRLYPMRACIGLIAAKLVQHKNYKELEKIYEEEMENAARGFKEEFGKLVKLLNSAPYG
jgi:hypothetical protein